MEFMAPLGAPGAGWFGDKSSYERILAAFYRGLFDAGLSADVVAPAPAAGRPPRWSAAGRCSSCPGLYIADDELLLRDSATTRRPAGTSCSRRAPATPTRRPSPGTR